VNLTGTTDNSTHFVNTVYTTSTSVTLDNYTTGWASDNSSTNDSGIGYYYVRNGDNNTTPDGDGTGWQTWDNLTLTLDNTSNGWNGVSTLTDNVSPGNKTINIWVKDLAHNVSSSYQTVSIYFDNVTPTLSVDNLTATGTGSISYTSSDTVSVNVTASDTGDGILGYYITESSSSVGNTDNWSASSWSPGQSYTFDNGTNEEKTVYIWARDKAGNISSDNASIVFDNSTPVVDDLTLSTTGFVFSGTYTFLGDATSKSTGASVELFLSASDNDSTDNFSSGWSQISWTYALSREGSTIWSGSTGWTSMDNVSVSSDNYSFDNATWNLTLSDNGTGYFDNRTTAGASVDNLTITVQLRDNASNESSVFSKIFNLDNQPRY